ncbi:MAG: IS630 family transposase [Thermoplasmata archaeon]
MIIGFLDESSLETTSNSQRLWSFNKPVIIKNTSKYRANSFGFYSYNGESVIEIYANSKQESVCDFLKKIRKANKLNEIVIILDNFNSHKTVCVSCISAIFKMHLIYLPPYSPQYNPIEKIWKALKKEISRLFIQNQEDLKDKIRFYFLEKAKNLSYCTNWMKEFTNIKV